MEQTLEGQVVAITGAGKGIGRDYALHLSQLGACVVVNNRCHENEDQSSADSVVEEISRAGGRAIAEYSSVEDPTAGDSLLAAALTNFGKLDGVIANAGIVENRSFRTQTLEQLRHVLEINLMGTINIVHPAFRHMCQQQSGSVIVSTSSAGLFGGFGLPAYSASKAALIGLMHSLSQEGAPKNVRVNAIAPYAATQMTAEHLPDDVVQRFGPECVAPVVARLLTSGVSGQVLIAGGGKVSRAGVRTSAPQALGDEEHWRQVLSAPLEQEFGSATQHFQAFVAA